MNKGTKRQGFTLIEMMVSAVLLAVGIVSIISAFTKLGNDQRISIQYEHMQRLALDKYDELVATEALQTQALNGDFSDRGEDSYLWSAAVNPTGTDTLTGLTVTVTQRDTTDNLQGVANGVVYQPAQTSTAGGTAGGGGTP